MTVAIVVPARNEAEVLPATLAELFRDPALPLEVVVVDGGSTDDTRELALALGARVLEAPAGRAWQMNAGARATRGDPIVFLHADTRLGAEHIRAMLGALADPGVAFGSFPIRIDRRGAFYRFTEWSANHRTRLDAAPYGDQAIFCRRRVFEAAGGYPEVEILEDVLLARRLRDEGRYVFLPGPPVRTSARRWEREGKLRTTWRNASTRVLFELGVEPARLRRWYDAWAKSPVRP